MNHEKLSDLAGLRDRAVRVARAAEIPLDKPELSVMLVTRLLAKAIEADEDGLRADLQSFNRRFTSDWCQKESPRDRFAHCFEQFIGGTLEDFLARAAIGLLLYVRAESHGGCRRGYAPTTPTRAWQRISPPTIPPSAGGYTPS